MILDTILSQLAPFECLGCSKEGCLICTECVTSVARVTSRCYRCRKITAGYKTCSTCRSHGELFSVVPFAVYEGLVKDLVWQLKFNGAQAAAKEMASLLNKLLAGIQPVLLVPVPTATSRRRIRGYDQALSLVQSLAHQTGLPYLDCLRRLGQAEQVGAGRRRRLTQLQGAYRCTKPALIEGQRIVLVDDVLTTGATLESAAKVLKAAGAKQISAVVFAQA